MSLTSDPARTRRVEGSAAEADEALAVDPVRSGVDSQAARPSEPTTPTTRTAAVPAARWNLCIVDPPQP